MSHLLNLVGGCGKYINANKYGKSAGYKRNEQMAHHADALIAVWDGESKGTKHMIDIANRKGLKVFIYDATQPIDTGNREVL